jgi:hypothetical protein
MAVRGGTTLEGPYRDQPTAADLEALKLARAHHLEHLAPADRESGGGLFYGYE